MSTHDFFLAGTMALALACIPNTESEVNDSDASGSSSSSSSSDSSSGGPRRLDATSTGAPAAASSSTTTSSSLDSSSGGETSSGSSGGVRVPAPVLWHQWEGTYTDEISGSDGIPVGSPSFAAGALDLDGSSWVDVSFFGPNYRMAIDSMTIHVRYWSRSDTGIHALVSLGGVGEDVGTNGYQVWTRMLDLEVVTETGLGEDHVAVLGAAPSIEAWHTVTVVADTGLITTYVDRILLSDVPYIPAQTTSSMLLVGASATRHGWDGLIDELRVWDVPLTAEQVAAL